MQQRPGDRSPRLPGLSAYERIADCCQRANVRLWRHGVGGNRRGDESHHDHGHGMHWPWARRPTAVGLLRRGKAVGTLSKNTQIFTAVRFRT